MNPAVVAAGASAGKSAAKAAKTGFTFAMSNPKNVAGAALILFGAYKAIPIKDFIPLPDFLLKNTESNKLENALVGGACVCLGLCLISK